MERQNDPSGVCSVNTQFQPQSASKRINPNIQRANNLWNMVTSKVKTGLSQADAMRSNVESSYARAQARRKSEVDTMKAQAKAVSLHRKQTADCKRKTGSAFGRPAHPVQRAPTGEVNKTNDPDAISFVRKQKQTITKFKPKKRISMYVQSKEEIVTFVNAEEAPIVGETSGNNVFSTGDATTDTDIENFFARPVRIDSYTWLESTVFGNVQRTIDPWSLWANNQAVKNKLNNYSWFRGDLHLKFQMTASPFYYGMLKQCYQPLPNFKPSTISIDPGTRYLIPYSQQPHVDMIVGDCDSYEMILPFVYPANWINIQSASAMSNLGRLRSIVYAALDSANGVTGTGIGITVYAWVENVELSGASVGFAMQSAESGPNDEFGEGPVSGVASWVANAATYLEDVPVLGPFATATKIGANAISAIASMFGFTNVPVIDDTKPYRPEGFPKMATSEIGFPVERMSLDPKNELSVDPRIIGLNNGLDEMSASYLASRESYLTTCTWSTTNLIDDTLFYALVNPTLYDNDNGTNPAIYMTPMAWVAKAFKDWRGSIIFRFHIVASKYHKGKLKISFDPSGYSATNIGNTANSSNIVHTAIIDIGETMNVEFHVPYQQALQFLTNRTDYSVANIKFANNTTLSSFQYDNNYDNGYLTLRVLTPLTAPVSSSTVRILTYVRAGSDFEYANPCPVDELLRLSSFAPQSAEMTMADSEAMELGPTRGTADHQYLVHYGENIRSLRQLLHRYELNSVEWIDPPAPSATPDKDLGIFSKFFYKFPRTMGYTTTSTVNASGAAFPHSGSFGYNFVAPTLLTYIAPGYIAYRGSINWTFNVQSQTPVSNLRVYKDNTGSVSARVTQQAVQCDNANRANDGIRLFPNTGASASCATNQNTQSVLNIQATNFSRYKFQSTNQVNANTGSVLDGSDLDAFVLEGAFQAPNNAAKPVQVFTYCATGPDFGLYFFLNVPVYWFYATSPAPI